MDKNNSGTKKWTKEYVFYLLCEWLALIAGGCALGNSIVSAVVVHDADVKRKLDIVNFSLILGSLSLGKVSKHLYGIVIKYKKIKASKAEPV